MLDMVRNWCMRMGTRYGGGLAIGAGPLVRSVGPHKKLKEAFPYIKGGFDFLLGFNQENGEFYFHHWGRKELICAGKALKKLIPPEVAKRWKVDVKKYPPFMR